VLNVRRAMVQRQHEADTGLPQWHRRVSGGIREESLIEEAAGDLPARAGEPMGTKQIGVPSLLARGMLCCASNRVQRSMRSRRARCRLGSSVDRWIRAEANAAPIIGGCRGSLPSERYIQARTAMPSPVRDN
jgi:hypothetical protein